jgi:hypothetical protein
VCANRVNNLSAEEYLRIRTSQIIADFGFNIILQALLIDLYSI